MARPATVVAGVGQQFADREKGVVGEVGPTGAPTGAIRTGPAGEVQGGPDRGVGAGGEREASAQRLRVRIRRFRHQRGLSQERPAEAIGRDRQTWERAVTPPTVDDLSDLARALRIRTRRLFCGQPVEGPSAVGLGVRASLHPWWLRMASEWLLMTPAYSPRP
ncbi:hypothetical protein CG736_28085 [Kitasatospora sp. CB02891]|nr:hypothetical protein CG736_28085 [Kitasatospora sp. CB02891]